jgi:hypothetical protein
MNKITRAVSPFDYEPDIFELGNHISFISPWGTRLYGRITHVNKLHTYYKVNVKEIYYNVGYEDRPQLAKSTYQTYQ